MSDKFYYRHTKQPYSIQMEISPEIAEEITIRLYPEGEQGRVFEFGMRWYNWGGSGYNVEVCVFDDAWKSFEKFDFLFKKLAELNGGISPDEMEEVLKSFGFKEIENVEFSNL